MLLCTALNSEVQDAAPVTIEILVARALEKSEQLLAKKSLFEQSKATAQHEAAWKNPSLTIAGSARHALDAWTPGFEIGVSQPFYFPKVQSLKREVAAFNVAIKEVELTYTKNAISAEVVRLAYAFVVQEWKVLYATNRKHRFTLLQSYLSRHTFASPQQKTSNFIVKERLRNLDAEQARLAGELESIREWLRSYVDSAVDTKLSLSWLNGTKELNDTEWIEPALKNNSTVLTSKATLKKAHAESALSRHEIWPEITLNASYGQEHDSSLKHMGMKQIVLRRIRS